MATVKKTDCTKCQAACRGLVGMQTGEATVENSMEFPQKTKNGTAL